MKNISLEYRKQLSAAMLKHLKESYPGLSASDICCVASTFYNEALELKKSNVVEKDNSPLTMKPRAK